MKRRPVTVYLILLVILISVGGIVREFVQFRRTKTLDRAVSEAGGFVLTKSFDWHLPGWLEEYGTISYDTPTGVGIESGSHPIPEELKLIAGIRGIKEVSLTTNQVGDYLVPVMKTFRNIDRLNLRGTDLSAESALQILDALPNLKELELSRDRFTKEEIDLLELKYPPKVRFID